MADPTITMLDIDALTPYESNPRHNDEAVDPVARSIEEYGFKVPMVISRDGTIVTGHTRYKAAKKLGLEKVPCIIADDLTDEQLRAFRIIDNKTAEIATWDLDLLQVELDGLDLDLEGWGLDELTVMEIQEAEEVDTPEAPTPRTKRGEIWTLGDHRLMCGDATDWDDIDALLDGTPVDLLLTDPPYGVEYVGKTKDALTIENDARDKEALADLLRGSFANCEQVMRPGAVFYVFHADSNGLLFRAALDELGLEVRQCLVWVKNVMVMGRQDYQWQHEPVLYGWKGGAGHDWFADRRQTTVLDDAVDLEKMTKAEMLDILKGLIGDDAPGSVLRFDRPTRSTDHPTAKPVPLIGYLMGNSSSRGGVVLDPFGGGGSTLMAAEQLRRRSYTMELDPHYCDVIIERWETFTGKTAKRERSNR